MLRGVTLLLSHRCNLRCSYCYQSERGSPARMSWATARAALDLLMEGAPATRAVELSGGEPTLEPALLRRCVEHLRAAGPIGESAECSLTTNGTLLDDDLVSFLADHDVRLDLSFDGVPAAQELRGEGSFATLDRLLLRIRSQHPGYFTHRVAVRMTVQRITLPYLAASVRYLIERGVSRVGVGPCMMTEPRWDARDEGVLRDQVGEIVADSLRHLDATGTIPVGFLTGGAPASSALPGAPQCAAVSGSSICVDAAGSVWGCPLFARSLRPLPPLATIAAELVSLGGVRDPALLARLAALPERARNHPLFAGSSRHCGARRCRDCELASDCHICPASICGGQHRADPQEVPAFDCAFSRVTLEARHQFRETRARARGSACPPELAGALRDVAKALRDESPRTRET